MGGAACVGRLELPEGMGWGEIGVHVGVCFVKASSISPGICWTNPCLSDTAANLGQGWLYEASPCQPGDSSAQAQAGHRKGVLLIVALLQHGGEVVAPDRLRV